MSIATSQSLSMFQHHPLGPEPSSAVSPGRARAFHSALFMQTIYQVGKTLEVLARARALQLGLVDVNTSRQTSASAYVGGLDFN